MLSRVAAVKAPRTRNRRRVTVSSGRRREGRESEPQRPNMSRNLPYSAVLLVLLFVMICCGSGAAAAGEASSPECSKRKRFVWRDKKDGETVSSLSVPSLLKVGTDVFAVAEAQCSKGAEGDFTGIASKLLALTDEQASKELDKTELKTQVLEECSSDEKCACRIADQAVSQGVKNLHVSRPTTVVRGSDIYMLAGNYSFDGASDFRAGGWGLMLVKGNVSEEGENNRIYWNDTYAIPWSYNVNQNEPLKRLVGSGGSGVKMEDGTLVFPLEGTRNKTNQGDGAAEEEKTVSLILHSKDTKFWTLSKGMSAGGCSDPSVVEWKDTKLMMMTACDDGRRRVYEIGDKGEEWTEALGTLSCVWGNKHKGEKVVRSGFITAEIDERKLMLVTLPVYAEKGNEKGVLHLWLTDNTHIVDIGPVFDDDAAASSLLYNSGTDGNKDELIALYEKKKGGEQPSLGMVSVLLTEQLERVKKVLATWKEVDDRVSNLCTSLIAEKDPSPDTACGAVKVTDGLVGFLSGNFSDGTWMDEYLGVNATVSNNGAAAATGPSNGVKFTGRGAGAEWPVGRQGENQLYHFANYNFTLVATVSIDKMPEGNTPIPLMGVRAGSNGGSKLIELSYDSGKKWQVLCGDGDTKELGSIGETDTPHHVVIFLRNGTQCTAYVDGQRVGNAQCELGSGESNEISHFYIGGDGGSAEIKGDVSVTVTNVLLYNRPWDDTEIGAFNPNKANIQVEVDRPVEGDAVQSSGG
ncbi:c71 surface protein, partial [Trypanosoma cruzi]